MRVRVTEQVASVMDVTYEFEYDGDLDEIEDGLDRASDEIARNIVRVNREIIETERVG